MPREVDERKTRRVLAKLRRAKQDAEARGEKLSDWEDEFMESVEARLERFGSAFTDPEKGDLAEPLSGRQRVKVREIGKKAKGQTKSKPGKTGDLARGKQAGLTTRKPMKRGGGFGAKKRKAFTPRVRDISEDIEAEEHETPETPPRPSGPPTLRILDGGKDED